MIKKETLPNGVRVITEQVPYVQSVSIGLWANSGARHETDASRGISHFLEHMLFKGTPTRSARQVAMEFDSIGGHVNAFTEKEYTCYYAKILSEHMCFAFEILADMFLNSKLETKDIEMEKKVVLEEIKRHEDTPDDLVHDVFLETVWGNHPLGKCILGTNQTVSNLTQSDLRQFIAQRYTPDAIVVAAAGNLVHEELVEKVSSLFGHLEGKQSVNTSIVPGFTNESKVTRKTTEQVHFCIGTHGFSHLDPEKFSLAVIDSTLGGGMSSRLFQEVRESRGLAYDIGSYSSSYREGGTFTVYGGTSPENVEEVIDLVQKEFSSIRQHNITPEELTRAKNQIRGGLVLSLEGMSSRMIRIAKSDLYFGRIVPMEELIARVMEVGHEDVAKVAERIFSESVFPMVAIGPLKKGKSGK